MNTIGRIAILAVFTAFMLQSCGSTEKETSSGITYTLVREGEGQIPVDGEYVVFGMKYGVGDSVWMDTAVDPPVAIQKMDSLWRSGGAIHEIFADMRAGDSVVFTVDAETLFSKTWNQQVPPDMSPTTEFFFNISLDSVMTTQEYNQWAQKIIDAEQRKAEAAQLEQLDKDIALIESYLEENNIEAQETESGLHYVIHEKGTGPEANPSDTVSVLYKGYLMNGEVFDSNIEEVARENGMYKEGVEYGPYDLVLGRSRVIRGWHEGLDLLNEGGKATFYIPSRLGYGPNSMGPMIPPNTVLLFDVELVDVKK